MVGVLTRLICGPTRRNLADAAAIGIFFLAKKKEKRTVRGQRLSTEGEASGSPGSLLADAKKKCDLKKTGKKTSAKGEKPRPTMASIHSRNEKKKSKFQNVLEKVKHCPFIYGPGRFFFIPSV